MPRLEKEIKSVAFEVKNFEEQEEYFEFEGYASTFGNIDLGDDVIVKGAFKESLKKSNSIPILWQHSMHEPIGRSIELYEDDKGLFIKAVMPKDDSLVKGRVMPQMRVGSIKEMSIGFFVKDYELKGDLRYLKEIELFETSLVTKAMNPQALLSGYKSIAAEQDLPIASREREWDSTDAVARIRTYTDSTETPTRNYRKYFMYFDADNADKLGSYKLPFADIVNGEPHIIPRAIFAIAGVLQGARGGVNIPDTDQARIKTIVDSIYKRMANKFDDDNLVSPFEKCFDSIKDIELTLKNNGFTNKEAKTLISKIKEFSLQRDVEEKNDQRDAEFKARILADLKDLTNFINKK